MIKELTYKYLYIVDIASMCTGFSSHSAEVIADFIWQLRLVVKFYYFACSIRRTKYSRTLDRTI